MLQTREKGQPNRQCVVIADNLTGANAVGVLLRKEGLDSYTLIGQIQDSAKLPNADCLAVSVETRGLPTNTSYDRVFHATSLLASPSVKLYAKRIDGTLRGNLGREVDAMLDALANDAIAIVAPCQPSAGRTLVGGHLLVDGVPIHKTQAARDHSSLVFTSDVVALFRLQSRYPVEGVPIGALEYCSERLGSEIARMVRVGVRTLVFDCLSYDDLDHIASAVIASGVPFIAVDPGTFTSCLAQKMLYTRRTRAKHALIAVGSTHPSARAQFDRFARRRDTYSVVVKTDQLLAGEEERQSEINRVCGLIAANSLSSACGFIGDGCLPEANPHIIDLNPPPHSHLITRSFAEITARLLRQDMSFGSVLACGGDTSLAICEQLGASGIRIMQEVLPLVSIGKLVGGSFADFPIICKSGRVGDEHALTKCVDHLLSL